MSGIPVLFLHFFYKSYGLFLGFALADRCDETGFFLNDLSFAAG